MNKLDKLKNKDIYRKFKLAKTYLKSSYNALESGDVRLATDGAYNAAELVMKSAILIQKETVPRRHKGVAQLFGLLYIKDGPLEKEIGSIVSEALELRNKARYEEKVKITKTHAQHNIELAENLIEFLENQLKDSPQNP